MTSKDKNPPNKAHLHIKTQKAVKRKKDGRKNYTGFRL